MVDVYVKYTHTPRAMFRVGDADSWDAAIIAVHQAAVDLYREDERVVGRWNSHLARAALCFNILLTDNGHDPKTWRWNNDNSERTSDGYIVTL